MDSLITLAQDPAAWVALMTLIAMEVVLGIDNLVFISILTNKLPEKDRERARKIGISLALIFRLALLGTIAVIVKLTQPVLTILGQSFSWRDIILIAGGLFLVWKSTKEIHHRVEGDDSSSVPMDSRSASLGPGVFDRQHYHSRRHDEPCADYGHCGARCGRGYVFCGHTVG
jgi:predicted tellurium resistance membrane protein TerC